MHVMIMLATIMLLGGFAVGFGSRVGGKPRPRLRRLGIIAFGAVVFAQVAFCFFAEKFGLAVGKILLVEGVVALLGVGLGMAVALLVRLLWQESNKPAQTVESPTQEQDRQMVLGMLRDGKVSGEQAAELLKALGPKAGPADRMPLTAPGLGSVFGAILVVIGFMLPWSYVRMNMPFGGSMKGYQTGVDVGFVGWIILLAGILPALFVCIPALDKHVRQGLLRMVIASLGGAFVIALLVRSPQGIGLWVVAAGFALQLSTAFYQAGLVGSSAQRSA